MASQRTQSICKHLYNYAQRLSNIVKVFIDRFDVKFDIFVVRHSFRCRYPMNLNSLGNCICVHHGNISAAAGLKPDTPGL